MQKTIERGTRKKKIDQSQDQFIVQTWKDFIPLMKPFSLPENVDSLQLQDIQKIWIEKFDQLLNTKDKAFYMCKPQTKDKIVQAAISALKLNHQKYQLALEYDYQSLFLGNPKQLLIYKNTYSLNNYLKKYRLPPSYQKLTEQLNRILNKIDQSVMERNICISLDKQISQINALTEKIKKMTQKQFVKPDAELKKLIKEIMIDFKSQQKRSQIILSLIRRNYGQYTRQLCKEFELYPKRRYSDGPKDQKYIDIQITKIDPQAQFQAFNNDDSEFDEQDINENEKIEQKIQKPVFITKPNQITDWKIVKCDNEKAYLNVQLPFFDRNCPINKVYVVNGNGIEKLIQQQIKKTDIVIQATLQSYQKGYCQYNFITENQKGKTISNKKIQLFYPNQKDDHTLFLMGICQKRYLIPNIEINSSQQVQKAEETFLKTTNQKFVKLFNCIEVSLGISAFLSSYSGSFVGWGEVYNYVQPPKLKENNSKDNENYFSLNQVNTTIQRPSIFSNISNIRKISTSGDYCLACDRQGKLWSFGKNANGQLGDGNSLQREQSEFSLAKKFEGSGIFFIDAKATSIGSSIALDSKGNIYRWGLNQSQTTQKPIKNRYGDIINYKIAQFEQFPNIIPYPMSKKYIHNPVKQIFTGQEFFYALTVKNELYGWGKYCFLGLGKMKEIIEDEIYWLCNPIELMKNVKKVSTGFEHTIVVKQDYTVWAWGNSKYFTQDQNKLIEIPMKLDINMKDLKDIICGPSFTVLHYEGQQKDRIQVIGNSQVFKKRQYELPGKCHKIVTGQTVIGVLI